MKCKFELCNRTVHATSENGYCHYHQSKKGRENILKSVEGINIGQNYQDYLSEANNRGTKRFGYRPK